MTEEQHRQPLQQNAHSTAQGNNRRTTEPRASRAPRRSDRGWNSRRRRRGGRSPPRKQNFHPTRLSATCANCGQQGHKLFRCVWPSIDGYIHGCSWCNTTQHEVDACPDYPVFFERTLQHVALHANRPLPAGMAKVWDELHELAEDHKKNLRLDMAMPTKFPWSQAGPRGLVLQDARPWEDLPREDLDYDRTDLWELPTDPKTVGKRTVMANLDELRSHPPPLPNAPLVPRGITAEQWATAYEGYRILTSSSEQ